MITQMRIDLFQLVAVPNLQIVQARGHIEYPFILVISENSLVKYANFSFKCQYKFDCFAIYKNRRIRMDNF